jgi:hypothetical protein
MAGVIIGISGISKAQEAVTIPVQDITVEATPERLARGEYLSKDVALCLDCHSARDWSKNTAPVIEGTWGEGGEPFPDFFGIVYSRNITPAGIGDWTDGELYRAITSGISKDGTALFPVMPYPTYGKMDQEDIFSIIAYIRTLAPIENEVPARELNPPFDELVNIMPAASSHKEIPDKSDTFAYGEYLTSFASCDECHTPRDEMGQYIEGMRLAGGVEFPLPTGLVVTANITPDEETGIGTWTREGFIARFAIYRDEDMLFPLTEGTPNSIMPWSRYCQMTDEDLGAIYDYISTLPAVHHEVDHYPGT